VGSFSGVIMSQGLHTAIRSAEWILEHVDPIVETVVLCARSFILCLSDFFISSTFLVVCLVFLVFWTDQPTDPSQAISLFFLRWRVSIFAAYILFFFFSLLWMDGSDFVSSKSVFLRGVAFALVDMYCDVTAE